MAVTFSGRFTSSGRTIIGPAGGAVATSDPYWNNVSFLLNYASGYGDAPTSPKALVDQGTTAARSETGGVFAAPANSWHGVFNGTANSVLQYDNSSNAFNFETRPFTIDGWINPAVYQTDDDGDIMTVMSTYQWSTGYRGGWQVYVSSTTRQMMFALSSTVYFIASPIIPLNTWTHFAVTRDGANAKIYINGQLGGSISDAPLTLPGVTSTYHPNRLRVGSAITDSGELTTPFNGRMDELRITDGIVRYTSDFTPPTAPYAVMG